MAIKQVISFGLDYSTIKELKSRAKREQKSTSQYLQDLIEKEFYDEKIEDKFKSIDSIIEDKFKVIDSIKEELKKEIIESREIENQRLLVVLNKLIEIINKRKGE